MLAGGMQPLSATLSENQVRIFGDQAIVTTLDTTALKVKGDTQQRAFRVLFHFRRIAGKWLLQTSQFTPFKGKPSAAQD